MGQTWARARVERSKKPHPAIKFVRGLSQRIHELDLDAATIQYTIAENAFRKHLETAKMEGFTKWGFKLLKQIKHHLAERRADESGEFQVHPYHVDPEDPAAKYIDPTDDNFKDWDMPDMKKPDIDTHYSKMPGKKQTYRWG